MKKKIAAFLLATAMSVAVIPVSAQAFVNLGECPVMNYVNKEEGVTPAVELDVFNNPVFTDVRELTSEQIQTMDIFNKPASRFPYNLSEAWNGKQLPFNDGVTYTVKTGYDEEYGMDQSRGYFVDIDGNTISYTLPGGWVRTWDYSTYYNFGFLTEAYVELLEFYSMSGTTFDENTDYMVSTMTDITTGKVYRFNDIAIDSIDNEGNIYFSRYEIMGPTMYNLKCYTAKLKEYPVVSVYLNGQKIAFDQAPVIENGRTLVGLRAIFQSLGAEVVWDGATSTVTATKDGTTISLTIGSTTATKNGQPIAIEVPAKIVNGRTMVPVRFIADCFGVTTDWNGDLRRVILTSN